MIRILLLSVFFVVAFAENINFSDCGNKEVKYVDIAPCSSKTNGNCNAKKGSEVTFTIEFTANRNSETGQLCGTASMQSVSVFIKSPSFNIPCKDICPQAGCPLKSGTVYTISSTFNLDSPITANNVNINLKITGDNNSPLACVNFKINITN